MVCLGRNSSIFRTNSCFRMELEGYCSLDGQIKTATTAQMRKGVNKSIVPREKREFSVGIIVIAKIMGVTAGV